jgi:uncharacterized protein (UPF0276 family)
MDSKIKGAGLGLRSRHLSRILETRPDVPWFEVLADNYMNPGVVPHRALEKVRSQYPVVFHGVGMNLGSTDPLDLNYLKNLSELIDRYQPEWVSDHLCWIGAEGLQTHDLLPLPFTQEAVRHTAERIKRVQDLLKRRILIENLSGYLQFAQAEMEEWEFVAAVAGAADCDLLLDVNNVFVNSENLRFDPARYLESIPVDRVKQMHLAGHLRSDGLLIDNHGAPIAEEVWNLYRAAVERFQGVPTLIEWDLNIPEFDVLYAESKKAQSILEEKIHVA